jgi:LuxR family maltose regulon positive regulatory protein
MQTHWVAQTKFVPPRIRDDFVPRRRLLDALCTALNTNLLTVISAPAGYGKTTLLAALYAQLSGKMVVWIALDEEDNDPVRFLTALVIALQKVQPEFETNLPVLLANSEQPASEMRRIMSALINEILAKCPEVWLLLDDLHLINEPAVYSVLDYLLERLPPQLHLLIATRHDPPLALARLRAHGQLAELRVPDLRFTTEEAMLFLNEKLRLSLTTDDLITLQTRAEGWAAGLRLLSVSLDRISSASERTAFIRDLAQTDQYVFDFLADEVLKRQEAATRAFLLDTSILPELTARLCNALTGRHDAQTMLEGLYQHNLFLTRSEGVSRTFRYHALFAEFLREQLRRERPDHISELHRRAAEAQKTTAPARAIAHYLAAELWDAAAQTIEAVSEEFIHQGFLKTLCSWIQALPTAIRDAHPRLLYLLGLCALQHGELNEALTLLEAARSGFEQADDQTGQGETLLLLLDTANRQHDYAQQAVLTQQALTFPLPVHGQVQLLMAQTWQALFQREHRQAAEALTQALDLTLNSQERSVYTVMATILNMHLALFPGDPARLEHHCRTALARFGQDAGVIRAGTLSLYSYLLFLRGAVQEAADAAAEAYSLCRQIGGLIYSEWQALYVRSLVMGVHGDFAAVERLWTEAIPHMQQISSIQPYVVAALYFVGRTQWAQKKFDEARQTEARIAAWVDPNEFPETTVARHFMRALSLISDHKFAEAERTLQQAYIIQQQWPHAVLFGAVRPLLAYLQLQSKREQEAWAQFAPFLAECEQRNRQGLLLQETTIAIPLLRLALERKARMEFAKRLLAMLDHAETPKPVLVADTGETLTPREVEILKLIVDGASNQTIAQKLVISEHTVKVHITNLLAKLQATSRTQAAARARELHLV